MVLIIWEHWTNKIHEQLSTIYEEKILTDVIIQVGKQKCEVHSFVIALFSKFFQDILQDARQEKEFDLPMHVCFTDISFDAVNTVLAFMYHGEMTVADDHISEVLYLVDLLDLQGLEDMRTYFADFPTAATNQLSDSKRFSTKDVNLLRQRIQAEIIPIEKSHVDSSDSEIECVEIDIDSEPKSPVGKRKRHFQSKGNSKRSKMKKTCPDKEKVRPTSIEDIKMKLLSEALKYSDIDFDHWPLDHLSLKIFHQINSDCRNPKQISNIQLSKEMSYFWHTFLSFSEEERKEFLTNISDEIIKDVCQTISMENKVPEILKSLSINSNVLGCAVFMLIYKEDLPVKLANKSYNIESISLKPLYEDRLQRALKLYQTTDLSMVQMCDICWVPCNIVEEEIAKNNFESFGKFDEAFQFALQLCGQGVSVEKILAMDKISNYSSEFRIILRHHMGKSITLPLDPYDERVKDAVNVWRLKLMTLQQASREFMVSFYVLCERASFTKKEYAAVLKSKRNSKKNIKGTQTSDSEQLSNYTMFSPEVNMHLKNIQADIIPIKKSSNGDSLASKAPCVKIKNETMSVSPVANRQNKINDSKTPCIKMENETVNESPVAERQHQIHDLETFNVKMATETPQTSPLAKRRNKIHDSEMDSVKMEMDTVHKSPLAKRKSEIESKEQFEECLLEKTCLMEEEILTINSENIKVDLLKKAEKYFGDNSDGHWPLDLLSIEILNQMNKDDLQDPKEISKISLINEMSYIWHKFVSLSENERKEFFKSISDKNIQYIYQAILAGNKVTKILKFYSFNLDVLDGVIFMLLYTKNLSLKLADDAYNMDEVSLKSLYEDRIQRALSLYQTTDLSLTELCNICWVPYKLVKEEIDKGNIDSFIKFDEAIQKVFRLCGEGIDAEEVLAMNENVKYSVEFKEILLHHIGKDISLPLPPYEDRIKDAICAWDKKSITVHEAAREHLVSFSALCKRILAPEREEHTTPSKSIEDSGEKVKDSFSDLCKKNLVPECEKFTTPSKSKDNSGKKVKKNSSRIIIYKYNGDDNQDSDNNDDRDDGDDDDDDRDNGDDDTDKDERPETNTPITRSRKAKQVASKKCKLTNKPSKSKTPSKQKFKEQMDDAIKSIQEEMSLSEVYKPNDTKDKTRKQKFKEQMDAAIKSIQEEMSASEVYKPYDTKDKTCKPEFKEQLNAVVKSVKEEMNASEIFQSHDTKDKTRKPKFKEQMNAAIKSVQEGMSPYEAFKLHGMRDKRNFSILKYNIEREDSVLHIEYDARVKMAIHAVRTGEMNCIDAGRQFCVNSGSLRYYDPKGCRNPSKRILYEQQMKAAFFACKEGMNFGKACKKYKIDTPKSRSILQYNLQAENPSIEEPYSIRFQRATDAVFTTDMPVSEAADVHLVNPQALAKFINNPRRGTERNLHTRRWPDLMSAAIKNVKEGMSASRAFKLHNLKDKRSMSILKFNAEREDSVLHIDYGLRFQLAKNALKNYEMSYIDASRQFCVNSASLRYYEPKEGKLPAKKFLFERQMKEAILACRDGMNFDEACKKFKINTARYQQVLQYNLQVDNPPIDEPYASRIQNAKDSILNGGMTLSQAADIYLVSPATLAKFFQDVKKQNTNFKSSKDGEAMSHKFNSRMLNAIRSCRSGVNIEKAFKLNRLKSQQSLECLRFNAQRSDAPIDVPYEERLRDGVAARMKKKMTISEAAQQFILSEFALTKACRMAKEGLKNITMEDIESKIDFPSVADLKSVFPNEIFDDDLESDDKLNRSKVTENLEKGEVIVENEPLTSESTDNAIKIQILKRYNKDRTPANSTPSGCDVESIIKINKDSDANPSCSTPVKIYRERLQLALEACLNMSMKRGDAAKMYQVSLSELNQCYETEWNRRHTKQTTE